MSTISKRILVTPVLGVGHVNACAGIAEPLLKNGHRVAFFLEKQFAGQLSKHGFEEIIYEIDYEPDDTAGTNNRTPGEQTAHFLLKNGILGNNDRFSQIERVINTAWDSDSKKIQLDHHLRQAIKTFKPDLFIVDDPKLQPAIYYSNKPWIKVISIAPLLYLYNIKSLPPGWSGLSNSESDRQKWPKYRKILQKIFYKKEENDLIEKMGYQRYPNDLLMPPTEALTIYAYPEEYNYPEIKEYYPDWFNIEVFNKNESNEKIDLKEFLPKDFYENDLNGNWSGKWIYVSMGSMGSIDLNLMHRLIKVLSKTNHKYIVSKGPRHEEYELTGNLWGDRYLPQVKILPVVDLVITHGGNNSVTETFAQGKPMIIMSLFVDQHDNAQRLSETNFAKQINPYDFDVNDLINAIDQLLNDDQLRQRLSKASNRIRNSNKHSELCAKIEEILMKN